MDGFFGEFYHSIDSKGRVIIPQDYRQDLGSDFYLSRGFDGCIWITPKHEWDSFRQQLRQLPTMDRESREFKRFFTSGATPCSFDKQGRILIPVGLRNHAKIIKDVVLVGMDNRIELWSLEKWTDQGEVTNERMDDITAHVRELGLLF